MREVPMSGERVFISYSTKDGAAFARVVRRLIEDEGLSVWQDIIALEGGRDWWSQIVAALSSESLEHFVLVITPAALASPVVRREIRLARQEGKAVSPIRGPGIEDPGKLPRWIGQIYDLDIAEHADTFLRVLKLPSLGIRVPMMVPEPPDDYVQRPAEFDALKRQLLDQQGDAVVVTAALRGAGGYGKTTLACALAHDPDISDAYLDGSLWVVLGETPGSLLGRLGDLITTLTGKKPQFDTVDAAAAALGDALGDRRILFVIDDAWRRTDLRPFLVGGKRTTRLITTRIDTVAPDSAFRQQVDSLGDIEALTLLTRGINDEEIKPWLPILKRLASQLGNWALLIKLVNGFIRNRMRRMGESVSQSLIAVRRRLDERGILAFDSWNEADRTHAVARTIGVSLSLLDAKSHDCFAELAVFPEDVDIPVSLVERLWAARAGLDAIDTEELLSWLEDLSLLLSLDFSRRIFRLHDTIRQYLRQSVGLADLRARNRVVADVLCAAEADESGELALRRYLFLNLLHHLDEAGDRAGIDLRLLDPAWLQRKLDAIQSPMELVEDYRYYGRDQFHDYLRRTLQLSASILARDPRQLMAQLHGRLLAYAEADAQPFRQRARDLAPKPVLMTANLSLTPPGAETTRLDGGRSQVWDMAVLPDGLLASAHTDGSVRIWDPSSGNQIHALKGHQGPVTALALLPDGRLASGGMDHSILIWNIDRTEEEHRLTGHKEEIHSLVVAPNGLLVSASGMRGFSGDIRFWSVESGEEVFCIKCDTENTALAALSNGRIAYARKDPEAWNFQIVVWSVIEDKQICILDAHTQSLTALVELPNGLLASCAYDQFVRMWDTETYTEAACWKLEDSPGALAALPDGRLGCGLCDGPIVVLNQESGNAEERLYGHSDRIVTLVVLPDGRLASGGWDGIIRLWTLNDSNKDSSDVGPTSPIAALGVLAEGSFAAKPLDETLRIFSSFASTDSKSIKVENVKSYHRLASGRFGPSRAIAIVNRRLVAFTTGGDNLGVIDLATEEIKYFPEKHPISLCALPGERLAVGRLKWGMSVSIPIMDCATGEETGVLEGHTGPVWAFALISDSCLVSGSDDKTIRFWDLGSNTPMGLLQRNHPIQALAAIDDSRIAYASINSIGVWNLRSNENLWTCFGHSDLIWSLITLPGQRLASCSADNTVRIWSTIDGSEVSRLEVDAPVQSLAMLKQDKLIAGDRLGRIHRIEIIE
jgi:WD40 repeat protein